MASRVQPVLTNPRPLILARPGRPARASLLVALGWIALGLAAPGAVRAAAGAPAAGTPPPSAAPAGTAAAAAVPEAGESFGEAIEVTVVNVDVVVRDRSGRQVTGLTRDDFSLFVDGKKVEIANFASQAAPPPAQPAAPGQAAAPVAAGTPARERLSLAVFVDNANLRPFDRNRLLKQLRGFLQKSLAPGDQVLIVAHDVKGLHLHHSFHDSLDSIPAVLDGLEKEAAGGLDRDQELRNTIGEMLVILESGCEDGADQALGLARAHAGREMANVQATYADLHSLLGSLDGVAGRKALLYVGDGVPTRVGAAATAVLEEVCGSDVHAGFSTVDATPPMRRVIADANASRVTVYTLEGTGQASYLPTRSVLSIAMSRDIDLDRQNSLTSLARETGGRAALNGSDFRRDLDEIAAEISGSYSLGFAPPAGRTAREHTIRVELNRPGLHANYRTGYRDRTAAERMEGVIEAALIDGQMDNPLGASVRLGAAHKDAGGGRVTVPLSVHVPFGRLSFLPREDGQQHGQVSIYIADMDSHGAQAPIQHVTLPLRLPKGEDGKILASVLGYDLKLVVEPGRQHIALAVSDDVARIASSLVQEIDVDKTGAVTAAAGAAPARGHH